MEESKNSSKLIIVGWDGASFGLVREWAQAGQLKTCERLINKGTFGMLKSTTPPITFPAIPSFMTGKNPGKHGIASFFRPQKDGAMGLMDSRSIRDEFWNIGSMSDRKKILINLPLTYPAKPLNGVIISGALTPTKEEEGFVFPSSLRGTMKGAMESYDVDVEFKYSPGKEKDYWHACEKVARNRMGLMRKLLRFSDWDVCIVYFTMLDRIQHHLFGRNGNYWILKGYKLMDEYLRELLTLSGEGCNLILFSDHGFGRSKGRFYPNAWLTKLGYLSHKKGKSHSSMMGKVRTIQFNTAMRILSRMIPNFLVQKGIKTLEKHSNSFNFESIDWDKSKLYATISGIHVNTDLGEERKTLLLDISRKLKELEDPETGKKLDVKVYQREDIFNGRHVDKLPDIVYSIEDYAYEPFASFEPILPVQSFRKEYRGWHREAGVLIAHGPDIDTGNIREASIMDLAPTILHLFNCPIPRDMDGRVIKEIFKRTSNASKRDVLLKELPSGWEESKIKDQIAALMKKGAI